MADINPGVGEESVGSLRIS